VIKKKKEPGEFYLWVKAQKQKLLDLESLSKTWKNPFWLRGLVVRALIYEAGRLGFDSRLRHTTLKVGAYQS